MHELHLFSSYQSRPFALIRFGFIQEEKISGEIIIDRIRADLMVITPSTSKPCAPTIFIAVDLETGLIADIKVAFDAQATNSAVVRSKGQSNS